MIHPWKAHYSLTKPFQKMRTARSKDKRALKQKLRQIFYKTEQNICL